MQPSALPAPKARGKGARYTPVSKRNDRPDAIAWLIRHHPQLSDVAVGKLLGTTKETIAKVRDRTHWNSANIKPRDPVILGLCTQSDLNAALIAAGERPPAAPCRCRSRTAEEIRGLRALKKRAIKGAARGPRPRAQLAPCWRSGSPSQPLDLLPEPQFLPLEPVSSISSGFGPGVLLIDLPFQNRVLLFKGPEPRRILHAGISFASGAGARPAGNPNYSTAKLLRPRRSMVMAAVGRMHPFLHCRILPRPTFLRNPFLPSPRPMLDDRDSLLRRLHEMRSEHRDLDTVIARLELSLTDQLQVQRLKKRKLKLKDEITWLESRLLPDIIA